jgi:DNA-binding response OmpR family regulator
MDTPRTVAEAPVLIVDDDVVIRTVLRSVLEDEGIEVAEAADGQAAVDYVRRQRPALILLDMGLPILDGVTVGLRVHSLYQSLPIIVLSADTRVVEKAGYIGAIAYLHKPFDIDALLDTVQSTLQASADNAPGR